MKYIKYFLIISFIFIFTIFLFQEKQNKILFIEENLLSVIFNNSSTYGLGMNYFYKTLEKTYYNNQDKQEKKTNISIERFIELIESNEVILARNSLFHNIKDCDNLKYLSKDGYYEYIVKIDKDENGNYIYKEIVRDTLNKGTYNFFNQEGNLWQRYLHNFDVCLWIIYGTSREDYTRFCDRLYYYFYRNEISNKCFGGNISEIK